MKVFLTRPNHPLRAPTMAHCYDSRRALPHRVRRARAEPLFNCVLISAPANIRMRRQPGCDEVNQRPLSDLPDFLASTGVLLLPPALTLALRPSSPEDFFVASSQVVCVRVNLNLWREALKEGGIILSSRPYWLVGWVEGWFGLIRLKWSRDSLWCSPTSFSTDICFSKPRPKYLYNYVFTLLLLSRQHPH